MKKILLVAVALSLALTAKAFAEEAKKADTVKPATAVTAPVKAEAVKTVETKAVEPAKAVAKPVLTANAESLLKGNITKLDNTTVSVKDNYGKEWTFKVGTASLKEYKVGDNVEVKYEKDNLKSIAKVVK